MKKKGSIGAADLMAELQANPEWVAQNAAREAKRAEAEARFREEEQPIIADLATVGFKVQSVWDFVNTNARYPAAIPVLIKHLGKRYHQRIHEGIIRALTTPDAKGVAGDIILTELKNEQDSENRWALANALTVVSDGNQAPAIKALLENETFEDVHERLKEALKMLGT